VKVILFQPQIPQNTGNIVRTCAVSGCSLILVRPLGFSVTSRWLKRAGLDYWEDVDVSFLDNLDDFLKTSTKNFYFFSSKVEQRYTELSYTKDSILIFGSETNGLPEHLSKQWPERFANIPMISGARCLNLATSVGIVIYEALRQQNFEF